MSARLLAIALFTAATHASPAYADAPQAPERAAEAPAPPCVASRRIRCPSPGEILDAANNAARQRPAQASFAAARQIYSYEPGAIYELYASPTRISAILLEPGEAVSAVAAGDTSRWMVTEAEAESENEPRAIILVKPQSANLATNIVIVTDRRTYLIEARAQGGERYSAEIAWTYPGQAETTGPRLDALNFSYRVRTVRGRRPVWAPSAVFDDGARTWIEFPEAVRAGELPPLFVITGEGAELVNYRVDGRRMVVDRVFDRAELRIGVRAPVIVRIERLGAPQERRARRLGGRP